ncbi:MAG: hypothetical protein AB8E82_10515 [Aureispira sp.]
MNLQSSKSTPKPITVEAFRFVQLQAPEIYTGKWDDAILIHHPNPDKVSNHKTSATIQKSSTLSAAKDRLSIKKALDPTRSLEKADDFTPFQSLSEVRRLNEKLYSFIFWLRENRELLERQSLEQATAKLVHLDNNQRLLVWENLFYQTQRESNQILVEALVRLLQADHFLRYYQAQRKQHEGSDIFPKEQLQKAAMASVVIPHQLFETDKEQPTAMTNNLDGLSKSLLANQLEVVVLEQKIKARKDTLVELSLAQKSITRSIDQEYELAWSEYKSRKAEWMQENTPTKEPAQEGEPAPIEKEQFEPFVFRASQDWGEPYLEKQISTTSWKLYQQFKSSEEASIADTQAAMEQSIGTLNRQKYHLLQKQAPKTLIHQGIHIPLRNRPMNNAYVFKAVPLEHKSGYYSIYATQYYEQGATKVQQVSARVVTSAGKQMNAVAYQPVYETGQYVTLQLFEEGIPLEKEDAFFKISGSFETEDRRYNSKFSYEKVHTDQLTSSATTRPDQFTQKIPLPNLFGVMDVQIAKFKKVNQTLCCYTEGEVSHIENILAREYKERETRNLIRSELTTEETRERESEDLKDTTSTERHELQSEISLMLQENENNSASASASAGGHYNFGTGGINFNINGALSTSSSSSSSSSFSEAETYAKEVTERAMKRLVEKTTYKRTSKMLREFEEKQKHGFDNRKGDKHVTGVYRWVDKIYKNELVNYGKRLMYKWMLPEPARNYKHLLISASQQDQGQACDSTVLTKPLSPAEQNVLRYWDIDVSNFDTLAAYYGLEIEEYPVRHLKIARSYAENFYQTGGQVKDGKPLHGSKSFDFEIPEGYLCKGFECRFTAKRHGANEDLFGDLIIGKASYAFDDESVNQFGRGATPTTITISFPFGGSQTITIPAFSPVEEYLPIALACQDVGNFAMTIEAGCEIKDETFDEFRAQMFAQMWEKYKEMLQAYEDALYEQCLKRQQEEAAANAANQEPDYGVPSATARAIEKREIKRLIIEQMMQKYYALIGWNNFPIGLNGYEADPCNNTLNVNTNDPLLRARLPYIRFLEQAFDWEIMAYTFYPYYWNDENSWADLLSQATSADHIFKAFLQAGMVDVVLPVRPGLEKSVAFFLETGRLWKGTGFIVDGQNDLYPAIEENLQI